VVSVAISTQEQITRVLARLRMEQQDCDPAELQHKTEMAHDEINSLLELLEHQQSQQKVSHVTHSQ
jgi:hypothetical protein